MDKFYKQDGQLFNGFITVDNGKLNTENLTVEGNSLLIGADLTGKAFTRSIFGEYGQYIVAISFVCYSRFLQQLHGHIMATGQLFIYLEKGGFFITELFYVGAFFTAAIIDTKIVWDIATVIGPIATVPNLLAILFLRKEIKSLMQNMLS